ncbi:hypothetical protein EYR41_008530 [Orbilia oligospora]|uniref:Uncharacterized protein n=1 Tax=Orbilia oligospora TaxID=2813651 RepID=A0A8H2DY03_ORBOL|nr:hypothetical protein EYR41_008530 [Orbilia oligospora]
MRLIRELNRKFSGFGEKRRYGVVDMHAFARMLDKKMSGIRCIKQLWVFVLALGVQYDMHYNI